MFLFYSSVVLWGDFRGFRSFRKFSEKTLRQGQLVKSITKKAERNYFVLSFSNKTTQMSTEDEGLCTKVVYLNFISYHWPKSPNSCSSKIFGKCAWTNGRKRDLTVFCIYTNDLALFYYTIFISQIHLTFKPFDILSKSILMYKFKFLT